MQCNEGMVCETSRCRYGSIMYGSHKCREKCQHQIKDVESKIAFIPIDEESRLIGNSYMMGFRDASQSLPIIDHTNIYYMIGRDNFKSGLSGNISIVELKRIAEIIKNVNPNIEIHPCYCCKHENEQGKYGGVCVGDDNHSMCITTYSGKIVHKANFVSNGKTPISKIEIGVDITKSENITNVRIVFGLEAQGHISTIQAEIKRWNDSYKKQFPDEEPLDMSYSKHVWDGIGKIIGWCPFTAALAYFEWLNDKKTT